MVDNIICYKKYSIQTQKFFSQKEWFFKGHIKNYPIVPGVILLESIMQSANILVNMLLSSYKKNSLMLVTSIIKTSFKDKVFPKDTIVISVKIIKKKNTFYLFDAYAKKKVAKDNIVCVSKFIGKIT